MELLLPRRCAGCGERGQVLCLSCRTRLRTPPERVFTRVDPHIPVFALGPYAGAHRGVVLAMKERNDWAVRGQVGAVVGAAVRHLQARGEVPARLVLVPAPTRVRSARLRGGDPVRQVCEAAGVPVCAALRLRAGTPDQGMLDAAARRRNLLGRVELQEVPRGPVVLVDDVVTTGSTLAASAERLLAAGCEVAGAVAIAAA